MPSTVVTKSEDKEIEEISKHLPYAIAKTLAVEAYKYNMEDALEALKRLWRNGYLQKYVDIIPELKELVRMGKLP